MKILVTGSNGFVGRAICSALEGRPHDVIRVVRKSITPWETPIGEVNESTDWSPIMRSGIEVVVHLAGRVPTFNDGVSNGDDHHAAINTMGTANLARQCLQHGVRRFIFISTVKVLGEGKEEIYRANDCAMPADAYAKSKWEAEQALWQIATGTQMEVVVIRAPLVYGPGVKGNFLRLMQAVDKKRPLPFGAVKNRRSLIYVGNLSEAICACLEHPGAAGNTFLVSDDDDVSTPELVRQIAAHLGRQPFLFPVPTQWLLWAGSFFERRDAVDRLLNCFYLDTSSIRTVVGWRPPYTRQQGLRATVLWYLSTKYAKA